MRQRAKDIFNDALEQPPAEQAAFLQSACAGDAELHAQVSELLVAHVQAGEFLASPTQGNNGAIPPIDTVELKPLTEGPGAVIGRYKLLQPIGEGGFGVVFMAEQTEPIRRKVALKIIKLGMDTKQVIARFEAERQALALMDHPHIARVLDAGATETGRPYFVMELVKGIPITEYCDRNNLATRERLELFMHVCHAVQHAHQKGIIHRDLKPRNVLVTLHDGRPVPKVIDFGIAKATQQPLTEKTMFTEFGQFVGTPVYMSPEQAELSGLDVDTRSDIYSLGVLLYELLTGKTPFDAARLRSAAFNEMQRIIREEEPPRPSTRLSTLGDELTSVATRRGIEPKKLRTLIQGDLDWIVMKALEKDRTRRYETANEFAKDVERHLHQEPVLAGPPGAGYKLRKFVKRNRASVAAGSVAVAGILFGLALSTYGYCQAAWDRDRAVKAERVAKEQECQAESTTRLLVDMLGAADPDKLHGPNYTVRQMLDHFAVDFDRGLTKGCSPKVEATVRTAVGRSYLALGLFPPAESYLRRALEVTRNEYGERSIEAAGCLHTLGEILLRKYEPLNAEPLLRDALSIRKELLGESHPDVAKTLSVLATCLSCEGLPDDAEPLYREALEIRRRVLGDEHLDVAESLCELSDLLFDRGAYEQAEKLWGEAKAIEERLGGHDPGLTARHLHRQGNALKWRGDYAAAEERYRESLELYRKRFGDSHPAVANGWSALGSVHFRRADYEAAEAAFRNAIAMQRRIYGDEHLLVLAEMKNLIEVLVTNGDKQEAASVLREALDMVPALLVGHHPMAGTLTDLLDVLQDAETAALAEPLYRQALALDRQRLSEQHPLLPQSLTNLGVILERQQKYDLAEPLLQEALRLRRNLLGDGHPNTQVTKASLVEVYCKMALHSDAEPLVLDLYAWVSGQSDPTLRKRYAPQVIEMIIKLYEGWDKPEQVVEWRAKLAEVNNGKDEP
jgi:tetratricopeptide (TPR) repeat protein